MLRFEGAEKQRAKDNVVVGVEGKYRYSSQHRSAARYCTAAEQSLSIIIV